MKTLFKRERLPIVKPFDVVVVKLLERPVTVDREITLKDGTVKTIKDYSVTVKPIRGKFESVTEKVVTKTEDGDEIVKPKKLDASELGERARLKLTQRAFEILNKAWEDGDIKEGSTIMIKVTKKGNKTFIDEIAVVDGDDVKAQDGGKAEEEEEEEEEEAEEEVKQEKKAETPKPSKVKLKG